MGSMWVRLPEWMIYDGEPPLPEVGEILPSLGLRVHGEVVPAAEDLPDAMTEIPADHPHEVRYWVTGRIEEPRDFDMDQGQGTTHAGVEFVVNVQRGYDGLDRHRRAVAASHSCQIPEHYGCVLQRLVLGVNVGRHRDG